MKALTLTLFALILTTTAEARSLKTSFDAKLTSFFLQPDTLLDNMDIINGAISIDFYTEQVTLTLQPRWSCPANELFCTAEMPAPIVTRLPIISISEGACNQTIYTAMVDRRPLDGLMEEITVIDASKSTCMDFMPTPVTQISLQILGPRPNHADEMHHFFATKLK